MQSYYHILSLQDLPSTYVLVFLLVFFLLDFPPITVGHFLSLGMISADNPFTDPYVHILALEGHFGITLLQNVYYVHLKIFGLNKHLIEVENTRVLKQ
jgi:hypothetical protein